MIDQLWLQVKARKRCEMENARQRVFPSWFLKEIAIFKDESDSFSC